MGGISLKDRGQGSKESLELLPRQEGETATQRVIDTDWSDFLRKDREKGVSFGVSPWILSLGSPLLFVFFFFIRCHVMSCLHPHLILYQVHIMRPTVSEYLLWDLLF